ncbi:Ganglioside-induced differentiation-associated protein 2, partial [Ameca splendens]
TVRRFLENHGNSIDTLVFAVSDTEESVYKKLLPLYYPRSKEEEKACLPLIPADIGNSEGEPVVPERQIRIAEKPGSLEDECEEESLDLDLGQVGNHAFARMEGDVDKQRKLILQGQMSEAAMQKQHQRNKVRTILESEDIFLVLVLVLLVVFRFIRDRVAGTADSVETPRRHDPKFMAIGE